MHDAAAGTAWYRRYGVKGIRVPRYLHGATVRAPSVIPHRAWDHPGRAEACGGSDGVVVVARERKALSLFLCWSDNSESPRALEKESRCSPVMGKPDSRCSRRPGLVANVMLCSLFLITFWQEPARPWAWRTLERGSDCNVPIAIP